jgi:hypothetical protein
MPNKSDRIVSYLPSTFKKQPRGQTLHAVVDAFGRELQDAENSLAAVMQSHWVDYADRLEQKINDLGRIAALYGLAPRADETVEAFREHLKRYIRAYLDGTVTVQGTLRITAQTLGLTIADDYEDLDTWWTRPDGDAVTVVEPDGRDAAEMTLGVSAAFDRGLSARAAQVQGTADLSLKIDGREKHMLSLEVDGAGPFEIDIAAGAEDPAAVPGQLIADNINAGVGQPIATFDGRFLTLTSPQRTPDSVIEVHDILNDAAEAVLGLPPRAYDGRDETPARVRGLVDLSGVLDLSQARYLRLLIDGQRLAEIDVAGPDPAHTLLDQIVEKMNEVLGPDTVTHDGRFLTLTSPTTGLGSSIVFQQAAAQQALLRLFGPISKTYVGRATLSAQVIGRRDLSGGLDLSQRARIRLRVDGGAQIEIECAGQAPANTQLPEVVAAINEAVNMQLASHNGRNVILTSPSSGLASEILFLTPEEEERDATALIFGILPRLFRGRAATAGRVIGTPDLSNTVDLQARYLLQLRPDGRPPVTIDLRTHAEGIRAATLRELADAIDAAVGADVAATDGQHLILVSATEGSGSSLEVVPLGTARRERFVTRAIVTGEAADAVLGFTRQVALGSDAVNARVVGTVDAHRGVDLRQNRYLRLVIDDHDPVEIDCAGDRPRATLIDEIVEKINSALAMTPRVASHNGRRLILTSHTLGKASRIAFEPPRTADALPLLLGVEPGEYRGHNAEQVRFVGTVDLSQGVDLTAGDRIKIGVDGAEPVEIACATNAADPASVRLNETMININLALGRNVVSHDGRYLQITSPTVGAGSQLLFAKPETGDATQAILGIDAPREYHGRDAAPAEVIGTIDLSNGVDLAFLQIIRYLRLGVDNRPAQDVDTLLPGIVQEGEDPRFVTLDEIIAAINDVLDATVAHEATDDDSHFLRLRSPTTGQASKLVIEPHSSGDARQALFGDVPDVTTGADPTPATLMGQADLLSPVDLSRRSVIRLAIDGGRPVEVNVAGFAPGATLLEEITEGINAVLPGIASGTPERRLQLTSPTAGSGSRLEVLPLRTIDLIEYPAFTAEAGRQTVRHNGAWFVDNRGAAAGTAEVLITAPLGVAGPALINETLGWQARLLTVLAPGETARIWATGGRLQAEIRPPAGEPRPVPGRQMLVGPLGAQAWVPFTDPWQLSGDGGPPPALQLNNPQADQVVWLPARQSVVPGQAVSVMVEDSDIPPATFDPLAADGQWVTLAGRLQVAEEPPIYRLADKDGNVLAILRDGAGLDLANYLDRVVVVGGTIHPDGDEPLLIVHQMDSLFTVTLAFTPAAGDSVTEVYERVTIGQDPAAENALVRLVHERPSSLVRAESLPKITVLSLPLGRSRWRYLDCYGPRFNYAYFDRATFPGGLCYERGVFDISRFANAPPEALAAVFTGLNDPPAAEVEIQFTTVRYQPGAFRVHLPADLPENFGGRFNLARFGQGKEKPELYEKVVTEPASDANHVTKVFDRSPLIEAMIVPRVPLGWVAAAIPFREPRSLTLGDARTQAGIYLNEEGIDGFLLIQAREPGAYGNHIAISIRPSGPAMYDFAVIYEGVPFENARQTVLGQPLALLTQESLEPGPAGVLQAKAAGVHAVVSREQTP